MTESRIPSGTVWINGELIPAAEARIDAFDHAITVGDGVFETIEARGGTAFALGRHLERMRRSADAMHIVPGWTDEQLRSGVAEVLEHNPGQGLVQ